MKVKLLLSGAAICAAVFFQAAAFGHDLVWPGEKLKAMYPEAVSFEQKNLYVSDEQKAAIERELGTRLPEEDLKPSIYLAVVKATPESPAKKAAAMMFIDAHGEGGKIEMGVVVSGKGDIRKVIIFENRESTKLMEQAFLKQFGGKRSSDAFKVGTDIKSPSGTEKSAQSIASGARRGLIIINEMFRKK